MTDRPKTEDEIAREKEAVEKMKGAKGAMELVLQRQATLETALKQVLIVVDEVKRAVGPSLLIKSYSHARGGDATIIPLQEVLQYALDVGRKPL